MDIIIEEKVLKYIFDKNYEGIILTKVNKSFGWVGCREIIQGEFIKEYSVILENRVGCYIRKVGGIKVLISQELKLEPIKEIRISEIFSAFSKEMVLDIETTEI